MNLSKIHKEAKKLTVEGMGQHLIEEYKRTKKTNRLQISMALLDIDKAVKFTLDNMKKVLPKIHGKRNVSKINFDKIYMNFHINLMSNSNMYISKKSPTKSIISRVSMSDLGHTPEFDEAILDVNRFSGLNNLIPNPTKIIDIDNTDNSLENLDVIGKSSKLIDVRYDKKAIKKMLRTQKTLKLYNPTSNPKKIKPLKK